jgi:hypothetical protein
MGYEPGPEPLPIHDRGVILQRFQRGVMRYEGASGRTASVPLGIYLRAVIRAEALPDLAIAASQSSPLWAQYNEEAVNWIDRPEELPDTNLVLVFEPD